MIVPDEVVIEALLKDARRFKSKWELHAGEPTRSKPNIKFLKRTLSNVIKINQDRMRKPKKLENYEDDLKISTHRKKDSHEKSSHSKHSSRSKHDSSTKRRSKKSKHCSKSKYRSPESRSRSLKKSQTKKDSSTSKDSDSEKR